VNHAKPVVRLTRIDTWLYNLVTITIMDQFGDPLDAVYDGKNVVKESFTLVHFIQGTTLPNDGPILGVLKKGVITDQCVMYLNRDVQSLWTKAQVDAWQAKTYAAPELGGKDNVFAYAQTVFGLYYGFTAIQKVTVHGYDLMSDYSRAMYSTGGPCNPVPLVFINEVP
jgi:hypothetical protein